MVQFFCKTLYIFFNIIYILICNLSFCHFIYVQGFSLVLVELVSISSNKNIECISNNLNPGGRPPCHLF